MPKQLKEINRFNLGIVLNASEKDAPDDSASFSLNVNPIATNGILDAINNDRLIVDIGDNVTSFVEPFTWGENNNLGLSEGSTYNKSRAKVQDISVFNNESLLEFSFIGALGKSELLTVNNIEPMWEQVKPNNLTAEQFVPTEDFTKDSDYITYYSAGGKATIVDAIDTTGVTNTDSVFTINVPSADGGYGTAVTIDIDKDKSTSDGTVAADTIELATGGPLSNAAVAVLIISAINGDDSSTAIEFGANIKTEVGVQGITATAGSDSAGDAVKITLTMDYTGDQGNNTTVLANSSGTAIVKLVNFEGGYDGNPQQAMGILTVANYSNIATNDSFTLVAEDGTSYTFKEGTDFESITSNLLTATNIMDAINEYPAAFKAYSSGATIHIWQVNPGLTGNTTITETDAGSNGITITQSFTGGLGIGLFNDKFKKGDYLAFAEADGSPAFSGRTAFETMQIIDFDETNYRAYVERNCFGTETTLLTGPVAATATMTVADGDAASGMVKNEYLTLISTDGDGIHYVITDTDDSGVATGTKLVSGTTNVGGGTTATKNGVAVGIGISSSPVTQNAFLVQLKAAIEHADGHNGRITVGDVPVQANGTQAVTLTNVSQTGFDGLEGNTTTTTDISQLTAADFTNGADGIPYFIYSNKFTMDGRQQSTRYGTCGLHGWSKNAGNHIGGNANYLTYAHDVAGQRVIGKSTMTDDIYKTTFSSKDKTISWNYVAAMPTQQSAYPQSVCENDYITIYFDQNTTSTTYLNNGKTFKVLKIDITAKTFTLDSAPLDETHEANIMYVETGLIKNFSFYHYKNTTDNTISAGQYKVNDWIHRSYDIGGTPSITTNQYTDVLAGDDNAAHVARVNTGGYWEDTIAVGSDLAANYYPFDSNDSFIKIKSEFVTISNYATQNALTADSNDTKIEFAFEMSLYLAFKDIILIDSEYMEVLSINEKLVTVTRGHYDSTIAAHSASTVPKRCVNNLISQNVSKDRLVAGEKYILSFYAKSPDSTPYAGQGFVSLRINGGSFNVSGRWEESVDDLLHGFYSAGSSGANLIQTTQEHRWISFKDLSMPNSDFPQDDTGVETIGLIDNVWRNYQLVFEMPPRVELKTDLIVEFASRGVDESYVGIDMVNLSKKIDLKFRSSEVSAISGTGIVDNAGKKDLVLYDDVKKKLSYILDFNTEAVQSFNIGEFNNTSVTAAKVISSSKGQSAFSSKNREVHVGFGGGKEDTFPQWIGYVNHRLFGKDYSDELYQDEDTVPRYGGATGSGAASFDKVCMAGEFEYVTATWNNGSTYLEVALAGHPFIVGDNVLIREWEDTNNSWIGSGVWVVTVITDNNFQCKRFTTLDKNPTNENFMSGPAGAGGGDGVRDDNVGKVNIRPYYYYGCKDGEPFIYRITPDTRILSSAAGLDSVYTQGTIERSGVLSQPVHSICTYYNKNATGKDGGRVYALSAGTDEVLVYDLNIDYKSWKVSTPSVHATLFLQAKPHIWSNDKVDGTYLNLYGPPLHGLAPPPSQVCPNINYTGVLSDILETKGPTSDSGNLYTIDATAPNNTPVNFDTRLWIQCRPAAEGENFGSSSRFLFCAKTEEDNTEGSYTLYMADRTPTTTRIWGCEFKYDHIVGGKFYGGPGPNTLNGDWHGPSPEGASGQAKWFSYFWSWIMYQGHTAAPGEDSLQALSARKFFTLGSSNSGLLDAGFRSVGFVNFGDNVGWKGSYQENFSLKVAKYGLFQIADNDCDGMLDGLGVVVPSNKSIIEGGTPSTLGYGLAYKTGPYGNLHQRVCSHAVGLIGGSTGKFVRNWGKMHAVDYIAYYSFRHEGNAKLTNTPEYVSLEKCIFTMADMHCGDSHNTSDAVAFADIVDTGETATEDEDKSWIELASNDRPHIWGFQAGDIIYIKPNSGTCVGGDFLGSTTGTGVAQSTVIEHVNYAQGKIKIPLKAPTSASSGLVYAHTFKPRWDGIGISGSSPGGAERMWHFGWHDGQPMNGNIHTNPDWGGHLTRHYYSPPSYAAIGGPINAGNFDTYAPGFVFPTEKLNFRAGEMIRPFSMDDADFNDLIVGNGCHVDMPALPENIYHKRSGSNLHYSVNDTSPHNQYASRLFLTTIVPTEQTDLQETSKIYAIDLNNMYPTAATSVAAQSSNTWHTGAGPASYYGLTDYHWEIWTGCTTRNAIQGYHTAQGDHAYGTSNDLGNVYYFRNVANNPVVEVETGGLIRNTNVFIAGSNMRRTNALIGMCLSIVDADTGSIQTRYVVASKQVKSNPAVHSSTANGNMLIQVHYPFQHAPQAFADTWFLWKQRNVVTAPIRLHKYKQLPHNLGWSSKADPVIEHASYRSSGKINILDSDGTTATANTAGIATGTTTFSINSTTGTMAGSGASGLGDNYRIATMSVAARAGVEPGMFILAAGVPGGTSVVRVFDDGLRLEMSKGATATSSSISQIIGNAHGLVTGDKVRIKNASLAGYNDIVTVTVTHPYIFTYPTSVASATGATADWELIEDSTNSMSNPLTIDLGRPYIKATYGGLDMRKLRTYVTSGTDIDGAGGTGGAGEGRATVTANKLADGDSVTIYQDTPATTPYPGYNGVYNIKDVGTNTFDFATLFAADDTNSMDVYVNQFELFIGASSGTMNIGELRYGFNKWDRGKIIGNTIRADKDDVEDVDIYINSTESSVEVQTNSTGNVAGDFFKKNTNYYYRLSYIYDGYQEGPLSNGVWQYNDTKSRGRLSVSIKLNEPSRRLSHVCLYRKDDTNDNYKLVKQISTEGGWRIEGVTYRKVIGDSGQLGASYAARTGLSEVLDTIKVKYGISQEIDGYLFVGDCSHERIQNASNMLFRSKPGMFSIFDYVNDFQTLKSKPTALINFNGRLYAFDSANIYKINQHSLTIEDIYEGIGCLGPNSVTVTEYGMFFADRNGAYMHNGTAPQKISEAIHVGGDLTKFEDVGSDNIYDLSWTNTIGSNLYETPKVVFDADTTSVLFVVDFTTSKTFGEEERSFSKSFIWSYNITNTRWDLWELAEGEEVGIPFVGKEGEVCIPIGSGIFHSRGSQSKKRYTWISKKLTMEEDSILKVYNKVKINGVTTNLSLGGDNLGSSDRLLLATSSGAITTADLNYSSSDTGYSSYKIRGTNKKGRWLQVKLEDMTEPVDSLGIIFRRKGTK
jgi:hypothetical protein